MQLQLLEKERATDGWDIIATDEKDESTADKNIVKMVKKLATERFTLLLLDILI